MPRPNKLVANGIPGCNICGGSGRFARGGKYHPCPKCEQLRGLPKPKKESTPTIPKPKRGISVVEETLEVAPPKDDFYWDKWCIGLGAWWDSTKDEIRMMRRDQLESALAGRGLKGDLHKPSVSWLRLRLAYALQEERRKALGLTTPPQVEERVQKLDATRTLPKWHVDFVTGEHIGGSEMSKSTGSTKTAKSDKAPRKTVSGFMLEFLRGKVIPTNEEIVAIVKKEFPESAFNKTHVSWYKGAFQAGRLPGQSGKGEIINQPFVRVPKEVEVKATTTAIEKKKSKVAPKTKTPPAKKVAPKKIAPKRKAAKK